MPNENATPKQVAYLSYMGVQNAERLSKAEASDAIENLESSIPASQADEYYERQYAWRRARFDLYPDLYTYEIKAFLRDELPEDLHQFVRSRVVGATERLTKTKIRSVVDSLTESDAAWWKRPEYRDTFFASLAHSYPGCVDGRAPTPKKASAPVAEAKKSGCLLMVFAIFTLAFLAFVVPRSSLTRRCCQPSDPRVS